MVDSSKIKAIYHKAEHSFMKRKTKQQNGTIWVVQLGAGNTSLYISCSLVGI